MRFDIVALGACSVDELLFVDQFPEAGSKARVTRRIRQGGGLAATALVAAARFGASTAWCGVLGYDELSIYSLSELTSEGVATDYIVRSPEAGPQHSTIIVEAHTGRRSVLSCNSAVVQYPADLVSAELISSCRMLFVDHTVADAGIRAVTLAHRASVPVVADIERLDEALMAGMLPLVDHLIVSKTMAGKLCGHNDPGQAAQALGAEHRYVVVTDGERGCWFVEEGGHARHQPALAVGAVDTTGCGDVFHGAYMAAWVQGADFAGAVRFATVAAGLKATKPGGRDGIPSRAQVEEYMVRLAPLQ